MRVLSVSQINFFIKSLIEGDGRMRDRRGPQESIQQQDGQQGFGGRERMHGFLAQ